MRRRAIEHPLDERFVLAPRIAIVPREVAQRLGKQVILEPVEAANLVARLVLLRQAVHPA